MANNQLQLKNLHGNGHSASCRGADLRLNDTVLANATGIRGPHSIPIERERKNTFCRIYSVKAGGRIVLTETVLEADAIYFAEGDPDVVSLCEQPMRIPIPVERSPYITLDLGLRRKSGREVFYEIKSESQLNTRPDGRRTPADWPLIEAWCAYHGFNCGVLTDIELSKHKQRIRNWRSLLPFVRIARERPNPTLEQQILDALEAHGPQRFGAMVDFLPPTPAQDVCAAQANLLHRGDVWAALDTEPLTTLSQMQRWQ